MEKPILYKVKYKMKGYRRFRVIRNVKGDMTLDQNTRAQNGTLEPWAVPTRLIIKDDETRIEIPMEGTIFQFSKERHINIVDKMKKAKEGNSNL